MFVMYLGNKDVSIALTFPWFLKQKMSFEVRDTVTAGPVAGDPSASDGSMGDLSSI